MIGPIKLRRKRILVDVDTQNDLLVATGANCIKNHRRVLMNIRRIVAWARIKGIKSVSTVLSKPQHNGDKFCIVGSQGIKKISYTLRGKRVVFNADNSTDLPRDIFSHYEQVILSKRVEDPFEEPRAERILTELKADEFIVIGAPAEGAVSPTVLGLLQRGKRVVVITDAIGVYDRKNAEVAFRKWQAKGAILLETKDLAGATHLKTAGICTCKICKLTEKELQAQASA
ncbi:MAG: cysteine hydrolase family protein [Planctomycetaceae bacterium]|nr:cysteine hydrolase family protein [Planctomycetaceae bacterium]